jgi:hypothetical protein
LDTLRHQYEEILKTPVKEPMKEPMTEISPIQKDDGSIHTIQKDVPGHRLLNDTGLQH